MTIIVKMVVVSWNKIQNEVTKYCTINSVYITVIISLRGVYNSNEEGDTLFNKTRPQTAEILVLKVDKTYTILY